MDMKTAVEIFAKHRGDAAALVSSGPSNLLWEVGHRDPTMYLTGMSYASSGALGLALARPDLKVVAIEGDGAMLMGLANLASIGRYAPKNLTVLVMDNGTYLGSFGGGLDSASAAGVDIAGVARAAGIRRSTSADSPEQLETAVRDAMSGQGPSMVVAKVDRTRELDRALQSKRPDRTEFTIAFQRHLRESLPPVDAESGPVRPTPPLPAPDPDRPGGQAGRRMYAAIKAAGIDFFVYLPDGELYPILEEAEADPGMIAVCCTREDEGIAIAGGASYGGRSPVVAMEGTGVGFSALVLAHQVLNRVPLVVLSSHSEAMGIRLPHNDVACMVNEPVLRALGLHTVVLPHLSEIELYMRESQRSAQVLKSPVAVVVPPYVMAEAAPD